MDEAMNRLMASAMLGIKARSSVRLERAAHNGLVAGSNPAAPTIAEAFGVAIAETAETWLTVEVCVRSDTPQAGQLREVCEEMFRRGLPVYVSVSKRGTPFKAG